MLARTTESCTGYKHSGDGRETGYEHSGDETERPHQSWDVRHFSAGRGESAAASQEIGNRKSSIWSTGSSTLLALTTESCTDYEHLGDDRDKLRAPRKRDRATKSVVGCAPFLGWQRQIHRCQPGNQISKLSIWSTGSSILLARTEESWIMWHV